MDLMVFGSCVSRDMIDFCRPEDVVVRAYMARQSWISIGNPVKKGLFPVNKFDSPFQERNYYNDLEGNAVNRIRTWKTKYPNLRLLIDLADERGGFFKNTDGGVISHAFNNPATIHLRKGMEGWSLIPFASAEHALLFTKAAQKLQLELKEIGIWGDTAILAHNWAERFPDGTPTPKSFTMTAKEANTKYFEYYEMLSSTGWNVVTPKIMHPTADPNHRWGPTPFHYTQDYYLSLHDALACSQFF